MIQYVLNRWLAENVPIAKAVQAPPQNPINLKARNPNAKSAARIRFACGDDFAMTKNREQPEPGRFNWEKAEEIAIRVFDVHCGKRDRIINARGRISLNDLPTNSPEE